MDVLVKGRRCTISDDFRDKVVERIRGLERLRDRVIKVEVQISTEAHAKQPDQAISCEITLHSKGPIVRAEAGADDKSVAFEAALEKLRAQLRKAADRRKSHRGKGAMPAVELPDLPVAETPEEPQATQMAGVEVLGDGPMVVREKHFVTAPMTLTQALDRMELVGHDFYLYVDAETRAPSVVYRRHAYDYGVIHLEIEE